MEPAADPSQGDGRERRCTNCGALVLSDADWCPQCFTPLKASEPEHAPEPEPLTVDPAEADPPPRPDVGEGAAEAPSMASSTAAEVPKPSATWPCATCGHRNPIDMNTCESCGTSFASTMRSDEKPREVDPADAMKRSLIFPGLGHGLVGMPLEGIARGALFGMLLLMVVIVLLSGLTSTIAVIVFIFFFALAALAYAGSAWEAYRIADGARPFVSSRALLWITAAVILGSSALLAFTLAIVAKR
jgi:RNA polymerase subunit RPABC4/transcription elongation factor Spt4